MKKTALIFLLAIFVPALILGGIALRTAGQQKIIIQQQQIELRQKEADDIAAQVRLAIGGEHQAFTDAVNRLLAATEPADLAREFTVRLHEAWPRKCIGFAVTAGGSILSPYVRSSTGAATVKFLRDNAPFLGNEVAAQVFQAGATPREELAKQMENSAQNANSAAQQTQKLKTVDSAAINDTKTEFTYAKKSLPLKAGSTSGALNSQPTAALNSRLAEAPAQTKEDRLYRKVAPQNVQQNAPNQPVSQLTVETSRFSKLVSDGHEGVLARFVQDELQILFWVRPDRDRDLVFGAQVDPKDLRDLLDPILAAQSRSGPPSYPFDPGTCVAILDDHAKLVAKSLPDFSADWKTPFVATEIGEALPHWEVALYLTNPDRLRHSARLVSVMLVSMIALALAAIAGGGCLVVIDTRRQLDLVRKKTDFVSNVSHELKTPLTSIRMFAELLHEKRVTDPDKVAGYLKIITLESERLTRLINNVLDFAKMERNQKRYDKRAIDLHAVLQKIWEGQELHLRGLGFETVWHAAEPPYRVFGDADALAQVIVNLLSNAEKYSGESKSIELHSYLMDGQVCVAVLDRGIGVPRGEEKKIFEHFYRAHDSLSSGIQGSGLGLTLAQKIAAGHGGTITCEPRKDGGTIFTLKIPEHREPA